MNVYKKKSDLKMELSSHCVRAKRTQQSATEKGLSYVTREITDEALEGCIVLRVRGDAMEKLIMDGAKVIIDPTEREITSSGIYALNIPWEVSILRECHIEPGGLMLRPYNKNYPEVLLSWNEFDPEMVIGKVVCSILNVFR